MGQSGFIRAGGQPIPGAIVTATQKDRKFSTVTGPDGRYTFVTLADGICTIDVRMFGFEPASKQLQVGGAAKTVDFNLELRHSPPAGLPARSAGAPVESEVPEPVPAADTGNSNESFLVSGSLSQGLAPNASPPQRMEMRDDSGATSVQAPGFADRGSPDTGGFGSRGGGFRRSGSSSGGRGQFGNRRGGANGFHGLVFFQLNNSELNAKPFSISGLDTPQPAYAQSRFGLVAGGPLVIPKVFQDPATFFSVSYFATRSRKPFSAFATVPTEGERQGDFSAAGSPIYDPLTRLPFPGNAVPASRLDPIAQKLLSFIPGPNSPGLVNNFAFYTSPPQNTDNFSLRLQRNLGKADRLAYHLTLQRRDGDNAQTFGFLDTTSGFGLSTDVQWTHNFSTTLINSARVTFNRNRNQTTPFFASGPDVATELGIAGTSNSPINFGPPNLNFTNFGALTDANPILTRNQSQTLGDNVILIRGHHTLTLGVQYGRNDLNTRTDQNGRGTFNFTGLATSALDQQGTPAPNSGYDFADFLLGLPQSSSIRYGDSSSYFRQNTWTGFASDEWKLGSRLTLNLGLRYEYFSPFAEKYGHIANLDIAPGYTTVAVVTPGQSGPFSGPFPSGLVNPDYNNFAPRLGLAWKLPGIKRSTILRAGYGIYYNGQAYNNFPLKLAQQPPFAVSSNVNTNPQDVLTLAEGFGSTSPADVTNTYAIDRNYRTPYAQTWNLLIQHELPRGFFIELGYVGTKGTRLDVQVVPNQGPPGSGSLTRGGYTFDESNADSIYHAVQMRAQRRFRGGLSMSAVYTFSKSIDDSSTFGGVGNTVAQNWLDLSGERGLSSFDHRHSFDMNWIVTSQAGTAGSRITPDSWAGRLLKDWQFTGSITAQTGSPLTARILGNTAQLAQTNGVGSGRADATGLDLLSGSGFFNLAAFAPPPPGQFGNAGRNTIPGPNLFSLNLGFGRSFQLDESRKRLEVRIEATNVLNTVSFANINTVVNAINYGAPISAGAMRTINAVVRFRF